MSVFFFFYVFRFPFSPRDDEVVVVVDDVICVSGILCNVRCEDLSEEHNVVELLIKLELDDVVPSVSSRRLPSKCRREVYR